MFASSLMLEIISVSHLIQNILQILEVFLEMFYGKVCLKITNFLVWDETVLHLGDNC